MQVRYALGVCALTLNMKSIGDLCGCDQHEEHADVEECSPFLTGIWVNFLS